MGDVVNSAWILDAQRSCHNDVFYGTGGAVSRIKI
jgi:hypothetical protein